MGNRSRFHARPSREWQRGYHEGQHQGEYNAIHLLLLDVPGSGVTASADGTWECDDTVGCHGCTLERHGFTRLASTWINQEPCERHR